MDGTTWPTLATALRDAGWEGTDQEASDWLRESAPPRGRLLPGLGTRPDGRQPLDAAGIPIGALAARARSVEWVEVEGEGPETAFLGFADVLVHCSTLGESTWMRAVTLLGEGATAPSARRMADAFGQAWIDDDRMRAMLDPGDDPAADVLRRRVEDVLSVTPADGPASAHLTRSTADGGEAEGSFHPNDASRTTMAAHGLVMKALREAGDRPAWRHDGHGPRRFLGSWTKVGATTSVARPNPGSAVVLAASRREATARIAAWAPTDGADREAARDAAVLLAGQRDGGRMAGGVAAARDRR